MSDRFKAIASKRARFNGKPFSHWEQMADELVIEQLVRAANLGEHQSLIGYLASKRLMELAQTENPTILERVLTTRDRCVQGFQQIMADLSS